MSARRGIRRRADGRIRVFEAGRRAGWEATVIPDLMAVHGAFEALAEERGRDVAEAVLAAVPQGVDPLRDLQAARNLQ